MAASTLRDISARNLRTLRDQPFAEISGAVGDLGTFLPLTIALAINETISLSSTLVCSGLFNLLTGIFFGIPLPVQPMKAIAAVAIANSFKNGEIAAAGIFVALCILVLSVTGILRWFSNAIPIPVVKGIQVGAGLSLIITSGGNLISRLGWITPSWADNRIWAIAAFVLLMTTNHFRTLPYALIVLLVGLVFASIIAARAADLPSFHPWKPVLATPSANEWHVGITTAGIGQLPLTTLNSVIAVVHLARDLIPEVETPEVTDVGLSVAMMNLVGCWFGAMPVCHGSGGLAAQYRFGARSGGSVIVLGLIKVVIGIFLGNTLVGLLRRFPLALLGIMVIAAGLELCGVGESLNTAGARDLDKASGIRRLEGNEEAAVLLEEDERKKRWTVMMVTVGFLVGFKNDAVGFIAGMLCHWSFLLPKYVHRFRECREGQIRLTD
ncbi:hypothetical protein VTN31DRAFT_3471 [Thermomyces dupontii]|uniref:uncharacterized protein n=1 Tax=Talaromyces thermophilus TaxID=28565 RepID=UPI00374222B4